MTELFKSKTRLGAWQQASRHLLAEGGRATNLVLSISNPETDGSGGEDARKAIDEFLVGEDQYPTHTVAETIFPGSQYIRNGANGVLRRYLEEDFRSLRSLDGHGWGTYAERLLRRESPGGSINPLEQLIAKMKNEISHSGPKRACYELGLFGGELATYDTSADGRARRGGAVLVAPLVQTLGR